MTSINNTSIVQYHIAISMGPSCTHRSKYNFSEETLTGQLLCPHCSKKFKTQGFKKHETNCKKQKDTKAEQVEFAIQYAQDQKRANSQRHSVEPQPAIPPPQPMEFKTMYHPSAGREPLLQTFEEFGVNSHPEEELPVDEEPWRPFCFRGNFEFVEIALNAALNKSQINALFALIGHISRGESWVTFSNDNELCKAWEHAAAQVTPFVKHNITVPYKKEQQVYETHALPLWDWALDLLANPLLAPHFNNGRKFEHFYNEPWTGDRWWDVQASSTNQSCLPSDIKAAPFCFILYVDKTRLLSHGTVKGYPVVVHCANLPVGIRNREGIGGGRVVGWLPIVSEDADEEGKPGFVNLKRVIWHEAFLKLLELVMQHSKSGYSHTCYDKIAHWLFPIILILSADYEEQCMMSLICGHHSKCPCPVCLVPLEELSELSKTFAFRTVEEAIAALNVYKVSKTRGEELLKALGLRAVTNVFWLIAHSDPHQAISFDHLHALHLSMWRHLLEELKKILKALGCDEESKVEKQVASFPQWHNLNHFSTIIHITFSDGNKMQDLSKQAFYSAVNVLNQRTSPEGYKLLRVISSYLQLDSHIGLDVHTSSTLAAIDAELLVFDSALKEYIECALNSPIVGLKLDWDFPKAHLWKHATRDIQMKGAVRNYSTRPNEKLHGPLKEAYERQSNGKDVTDQILRVDMRKFAAKMLRAHVDVLDERHTLAGEGNDDDEDPNPVAFEGHIKLGSTQQPVAIQDIETHSGQLDRAFQGFRKKFSDFINNSLPTYGYRLERWIREHRFLKVHYKSIIDWKQTTDYLRCTPGFHGQLHYDCALIQLAQKVSVFVRLVFIFSCQLLDVGSFEFALVQPFTAGIGASCRASSIFIPVQSFICGAVCFPDPDHRDEFLVVDHIDSDMFVCMKSRPACQ
ncbi:uncharacterized protein EDB93DRAFT_1240030 [Suillus bovinus]|uniref:uncharacterized protein n=1 Tax=Suillus bovinus TaxID=48563 RepID=UPI001B86A12A|nr:uncharacterized protein EDB93DRAFT_1240030 [Suillus bovinus]KAG2151677.1 hypothetical protein EDB93DRAFT_1240030 [Suillus bovinus]